MMRFAMPANDTKIYIRVMDAAEGMYSEGQQHDYDTRYLKS